jgi:hypothetical protein
MNKKSLNHQEKFTILYSLLGKAVWSIQHLEDALNPAIAIKNPKAINRVAGDKIRNSNRERPLGRAIGRAEQEKIFDEVFQKKLKSFLTERNWLIHRCMHESVDDVGMILDDNQLFQRIKNIELLATSLKEAIEIDMINFCSSNGRNDIRETVAQEYAKWLNHYSGS